MDTPSFVTDKPTFAFLITPVPELAEEALPGLEQAVLASVLPHLQVFQRRVASTTHSFLRGTDEDGKVRYLLCVELGTVGAFPPEEFAREAEGLGAELKKRLAHHATVTSPFVQIGAD